MAKPSPLISKECLFITEIATIKWNKSIYKENLNLLIKARAKEREQDNIIPEENKKNHKKILNMLKTLKPIVFHVIPNDSTKKRFFFQPFDKIDDKKSKISMPFDMLFFCSIDAVKKALSYKKQA